MSTQVERAIGQIKDKVKPDIDFTQHILENGEVVSTLERVVKDVRFQPYPIVKANFHPTLGPSPGDVYPNRGAVLGKGGTGSVKTRYWFS